MYRWESSLHFTEELREDSVTPMGFLTFPPEIMLHIRTFFNDTRNRSKLSLIMIAVSYLDLPELAIVAQVAPSLIPLTNDPVLHNHRLRIVYPSRVKHDLFGKSPAGQPFRPTMVDLVRRGVVKGLALERRFRMGAYVYSLNVSICYICDFLMQFSDTVFHHIVHRSIRGW